MKRKKLSEPAVPFHYLPDSASLDGSQSQMDKDIEEISCQLGLGDEQDFIVLPLPLLLPLLPLVFSVSFLLVVSGSHCRSTRQQAIRDMISFWKGVRGSMIGHQHVEYGLFTFKWGEGDK